MNKSPNVGRATINVRLDLSRLSEGMTSTLFMNARRCLAATVILAAFNSVASGQTINLVCSGKYRSYEKGTDFVDANVAPGATQVDLERKLISTPAGQFRISKVEETRIYINEERQNLVVWGSLDRLSGELSVFMLRPTEHAKMRNGLSAKVETNIELRCSVSKRLF
jgi:hypothetical protein